MALPGFHCFFALLLCVLCLLLLAFRFSQIDNEYKAEISSVHDKGLHLQDQTFPVGRNNSSPKPFSKVRLRWDLNARHSNLTIPEISRGILYHPSSNGYLSAYNAYAGCAVWNQSLQELTGFNGTVESIATPTIAEDLLIVGIHGPAAVIAVDRRCGTLVWLTTLDHDPSAVISISGTYNNGYYYVGVSSLQETLKSDKSCTFRGSVAKLDAKTGKIMWRTYMLPENLRGGDGVYAGAAIWGSNPPIDTKRNLVYVATGNVYSVPKRICECETMKNNQSECVEPGNYAASIVGLDLDSGKVRWYRWLRSKVLWFFECDDLLDPDCPYVPNLDGVNFNEAPIVLHRRVYGVWEEMVLF